MSNQFESSESFLKYKVQQTEIFVILGHFLPFYLPDNPENQNFEKLKTKTKKKTPEYIIILQICTINDNHIMNLSWDMVRYRHNFLVILDSFLTFSLLPFCPFLPYWPRKLKFWKNVKKFLKILSFNKCVPQMTIIWFLRYRAWQTTFWVI